MPIPSSCAQVWDDVDQWGEVHHTRDWEHTVSDFPAILHKIQESGVEIVTFSDVASKPLLLIFLVLGKMFLKAAEGALAFYPKQ